MCLIAASPQCDDRGDTVFSRMRIERTEQPT